jgi:EAL domain-containing protein (putative c-di-GMP-specific phosphodiesterase class I)
VAMYQAKAEGRNMVRYFSDTVQAEVTKRADLESDLRDGLRLRQFVIFLQPLVNSDREVTGAEALVRWQYPGRGFVSPADFIPLAEETGLIVPLGKQVIEAACAQLVTWARQAHTEHLNLSVNVSVKQFRQVDFEEQLLAEIDRSGANPHRLKLELTESLLVSDMDSVIAKMTALQARGLGFSLDDFGTGYSSLSYLKKLPLDQLKIDKSFVNDVNTNSDDAAIARAIITLARSLELSVVAEGVETQAQFDFLLKEGCLGYQGYLFARPMSQPDFEKYLSQHS